MLLRSDQLSNNCLELERDINICDIYKNIWQSLQLQQVHAENCLQRLNQQVKVKLTGFVFVALACASHVFHTVTV